MSSISPGDKKRMIFNYLLQDKELVKLIDGKKDNGMPIDIPDELLGKYIFPFLKIDYTVENTGTYIGLKIDYHNTNKNPVIKDMLLTFLILSNNKHLLTNNGDTRTDRIGDRLNKLLVWNNTLGLTIKLVSDEEDPFDENFYYRKIVFSSMEEDNIKNGKKYIANI